jgi:hypothetical protein
VQFPCMASMPVPKDQYTNFWGIYPATQYVLLRAN